MTKYKRGITQLKKLIVHPKSLLVWYAFLDVVWTYVSTRSKQGEAVVEGLRRGSDIDFMYSPFQLTILGPGILLVASAALWVSRTWSYVTAIAASCWVLYRGVIKWDAIASSQFPEISMWSGKILRHWWMYGGAEWEFPRFILASLIIVYATTCLIRSGCTSPLK
jgi:hypothetical protein